MSFPIQYRYVAAEDGYLSPSHGRPSALIAADELSQLYPMWEKFGEVRREWDPTGVFMNAHLQRVLGQP